MNLRGQVALVTGPSSGIVLGIARGLAGADADIVLNGFGEANEIKVPRQKIDAEYGVVSAVRQEPGALPWNQVLAVGLFDVSAMREKGWERLVGIAFAHAAARWRLDRALSMLI